MTIFKIADNRFATGTKNKKATAVVAKTGKLVHGVRGVRPVLDERFETTKSAPAWAVAALKQQLGA